MPWIRIIGQHFPMQCEEHFSLPFLLCLVYLEPNAISYKNRKRNNNGKIYINENGGPCEACSV